MALMRKKILQCTNYSGPCWLSCTSHRSPPTHPSVCLAEPPHLAAYQKGLHSSRHRFPDKKHKSEPPGEPELLRPLAKRAKVRDTVQTRGLVHMLQLSSLGHVWGTLGKGKKSQVLCARKCLLIPHALNGCMGRLYTNRQQ